MKILVAKKLKMTRVFNKDGVVCAVTAVEAKPAKVKEIISTDKRGYSAIKVGIENRKKSKSTEFRTEKIEVKVGDQLSVGDFAAGDKVKIIGTSRGKGFAGTIKRHNFVQGPKTHGSNQQRRVGSIGSGYPEHVFKGMKMAGHMGHARVTVKNLEIVDVDAENKILLIAGAIPGPTGSEVRIIGNDF